MDIAAAKPVNRLLGVADHHQPAALAAIDRTIDPIQDAVLDAVGILKLVDQRHRPGAVQGFGQACFPVRLPIALQGVVHTQQQIIESMLVSVLQSRVRFVSGPLRRRAPECLRRPVAQLLQRRCAFLRKCCGRQHLGVGLALGRNAVELACIRQRAIEVAGRQLLRGIVDEVGQCRPVRAQRTGLGKQRIARDQRTQTRRPGFGQGLLDFGRAQTRDDRVGHQAQTQLAGERTATEFERTALLQPHQRTVGIALLQVAQQVSGQLVHQRVGSDQIAALKRTAARERMIGDDAATQAMQGADRRHVQLGDGEPDTCQILRAARGILLPARMQPLCIRFCAVRVARLLDTGLALRPEQPGAQAFAQFLCCRVGERGHHDLPRRQSELQHQAQVQHRDRPGLAGTGAGLDQAAAALAQRHVAPIDGGHRRAHAGTACGSGSVMQRSSSPAKCRSDSSSASPAAKRRSPANSRL